MNHLTTLLLGLLRRLLSSTLVTSSIQRLLQLINAIRRRFSKEMQSRRKDTPQACIPPPLHHTSHDLPVRDVICASLQPPSRETDTDSPYVPNDHHEQHASPPIHSPIPQKLEGYLLPNAYGSPHESRSSQDLRILTREERNPDAISMSSRQSARVPSPSAILPPLSYHGLVRNTSRPSSRNSQRSGIQRPFSRTSKRPNSCVSQPKKVSRAPTPASLNIASPAGAVPPEISRHGSPPPFRTLLPIPAVHVKRWERDITAPTDLNFCIVAPLKFKFDDGDLPSGWTRYTHPDGARYFFHEAKRIYTDANLYDPEEAVVITESANQIWAELDKMARDEGVTLSSDIELALEIIPQEDDPICGYYFVEHSSRCLFWLEDYDAEQICAPEIRVVVSLSHLRYEIESQYWTHWELFPNNRDVTPSLAHELRDFALHATADTATSRTSTALWNKEENKTLLTLVKHVIASPGKRAGYSAWVIGRMMRNLTHNQFVHFHGQRCARLDRDQSVHGSSVYPRTLLVTVLSPFLFWAPDVHLQALEKIWVDKLVHLGPWSQFIDKLNTEWQEFIIVGTVLLNANVAFLAIQSVDNGGTMVINRSAAQISCYVSMVTSLGSVMLALLLVRQNRSESRQSMEKAAIFLGSMTHKTRGLETLAILYSMPYALLMWSTLSFLLAFLFTCFFFSSAATRISVGTFLVVVTIFIVWCIRTAWENEFNVTSLHLTWLAALWETCKAIPTCGRRPDDASREQRELSDDPTSFGDAPTEDEKQDTKRQRSWPLMIFVRRPTVDPRVRVNSDEEEKAGA